MKTLRENNKHFGAQIRSGIGMFLASCFFMGVVALAMHHHDGYFLLKNCAICKVKASFSGTFSKIKTDIPLSAVVDHHASLELHLALSQIPYNRQTPFIASLLPNPLLNKAPPYLS